MSSATDTAGSPSLMSEFHRDFSVTQDGSILSPIAMVTDEAGHLTVTRVSFLSQELQDYLKLSDKTRKEFAVSAAASLLNYWARKSHGLTIRLDGDTGRGETFRLFDSCDPIWRYNGGPHASEALKGRQDIWVKEGSPDQVFDAKQWSDNWERHEPNEFSVTVGLEGVEGSTGATATLRVLIHPEQEFRHTTQLALKRLKEEDSQEKEVAPGDVPQEDSQANEVAAGDGPHTVAANASSEQGESSADH